MAQSEQRRRAGTLNGNGEKRPPGRPRSEESRQAILRSTLKLLKETGFPQLSIEAIAADADVSKATVYRWWPTKAALVADAFSASADEELRFPNTGSVRRDISLQMRRVVRVFRSERGKVVAALLGGGQSDPELIAAFRERFLWPRRRQAYQSASGQRNRRVMAGLDLGNHLGNGRRNLVLAELASVAPFGKIAIDCRSLRRE